MSGFTPDDVQRLAALSQLELTAGETDAFARQLSDILAFATEVQAVGAAGESSANSVPMCDPQAATREDVVLPALDRAIVLDAAPAADRRSGVIKVPRVLNG